jgi:hypothetical protein
VSHSRSQLYNGINTAGTVFFLREKTNSNLVDEKRIYGDFKKVVKSLLHVPLWGREDSNGFKYGGGGREILTTYPPHCALYVPVLGS